MELPGKKIQSKLESIKKNVKRSYDYFKPNYDRFNDFRKFVFETSLSPEDVTFLVSIGRPQLEFNILEAYISRLLGEFSKQEPDIEVSAADPSQVQPQMIQLVEGHLRHTLSDYNNEHTRYEVYKDLLSGGFSVLKVFTDYESPMSMRQNIYIERAFDPTLCGFDHMARFSHKGDGRYCFELFPMSKEEFEEQYPDIDLDSLSFRRQFEGFNWSYINDNNESLIVCDYYEKRSKEIKIVQVRDGRVMPLHEYEAEIANWSDPGTVPPAIIGKPRKTKIEHIVRYRLIENMVIEHEETDYTMLPLVFVDGNSVMIKGHKNGDVRQMTRPYVYHAKGAQKLKNFAGISLANAIENEVQHKFVVAKEALPKEEELLQAYEDVQKASVLVYNSVHENDPDKPILNPISPVQKVPAPPEIVQALQMTDSIIQMELGSYDASLGINNNQLSGIAVVEAASQSNAAAMPFIVGFMQGLQRAAQLYVELMPKYFITPRTIPAVDKEGKRHYIPINPNNKPTFGYDSNALNVSVKAGASFQVQKSRTINMIEGLIRMSPSMQQFFGTTAKGLNFIFENLEGKGVDQLKIEIDQFIQQQQKQQAQEQAQAQQNPAMMRAQVDMQKLQLESQKAQMQHQIDLLKLEAEHNKIDAELHMSANKDKMDITRAAIDHHDKLSDKVLRAFDMDHKHAMDRHHATKPEKPEKPRKTK